MTSAKRGTARLFFAAWPGREVQQALGDLAQRLQSECGGRALPSRNIHLTLVFLGEVARDRMPRVEEIAAQVSAPPFELAVSRVEYWRHNRVIWAGVDSCPDVLRVLVDCLERALAEGGYSFDRRTYVPHVTLLRNARRSPPDPTMRTLVWSVSRYALVESVPSERGRRYEVLWEWPLGT
jgi:RNA 2',3'-cyclic 3'-phosphodiesterase